MRSDEVHFLSVDARTGEATRVPTAALVRASRRARLLPRSLRAGVPVDDLSQAGWGVVFPENADGRVRDALADLIELRRGQAGERFEELTYRSGEAAGQFLARKREGYGPVEPERIPYYLLLVGDADEIPRGFEVGLDSRHAVGRLCLPSPEAYARYAAAVRAAEGRAVAEPGERPRLAVFSPTHGEDLGTQECVEHLACPVAAHFAGRDGGQLQSAVLGSAATREAFLGLLTGPGAKVVLTAGHGVMYASRSPLQRRLQGALVTADWRGKGELRMEDLIEPSVLPQEIAASGSVFFLFGCYTGGTPRIHGLDTRPPSRRRVVAEKPFVASLPQALLERGALAVVAHVDQACTTAFMWEKHGQVGVFQAALEGLLDGRRIGYALEPFAERYLQIAAALLAGIPRYGGGDGEGLGLKLWMAYQDARGMAILGDPAVRLPQPSRKESGVRPSDP